jgi:uncharacterized membrane protein YtjA (UPF0391 family)
MPNWSRPAVNPSAFCLVGNNQRSCSFAKDKHRAWRFPVLKWALFFFIIAIVAGIFGFTGIASGAAAIAKFLFVAAIVIFLIFLVLGVIAVNAVT